VGMDLRRKALFLAWFTVGYNIIEGVLSIAVGVASESVALVGFGLDSAVETLSAAVMIWRFRNYDTISEEEEERVERRATRLVGYTFIILAAYVVFESIRSLWVREVPERTLLGILIASVSLLVMPFLARVKYRTGQALGSRSLVADSRETLACSLLSAALLVGLGLNYAFGLWQADPLAGLLIAVFLVREGYEALAGEG
jgi:divalent metal cation (Fe/Co/Zn/Cd) transporter